MQEATARSYFPSWEAIKKHKEVVKFTCGLMPDPRPLVDYVYTTCIEYVLEQMRNRSYMAHLDTSNFESLYRESAVPLPGSALHNQHINYYDHISAGPRDTTTVFIPSKLYVFNSMKEVVKLDNKTPETRVKDPGQSESNGDPQECTIWVHYPLTKNLLSLCETISASQPVTDFLFLTFETTVRMNRNPSQSEPNNCNSHKCSISIETDKSHVDRMLSLCKTLSSSQPVTHFHLEVGLLFDLSGDRYELTEANIPVMSKHAKSLVLRDVDASSSVLNYLLQHGSLEVLQLKSTHLPDAAVPLIFNLRKLKVLSLWGACMSPEMCKYVCHHLGDLVHLEYIDLSVIDLSHISTFRLSNTTSPVTLKLSGTHMSPNLFKSICQLTSVVKLKELILLGNTLTRQLHHLVSEPHQGLQSLEVLNLCETDLNINDIRVIRQVIQRHMLPGLNGLALSFNKLDTMEREIEELIRTCVTHHQRELRLWLEYNILSKEIQDKWKQLCEGTHIKLDITFFF